MLDKKKIAFLERQNEMLQNKIDALEAELAKYKDLEQVMLNAKASYLECIQESKEATAKARATTNEINSLLNSMRKLYRR